MQKKGSKKYWSRKTVRSGYEARVRKTLDEEKINYGYETIKLRYIKDECKNCGHPVKVGTYTPDFIIERTDGKRLIVETKGRFTSSDRTKMLNVRRDNPSEDIRFLFQRDQPIRKGSQTYYTTWCDKNGFLCAVGETIPRSWLKCKKS